MIQTRLPFEIERSWAEVLEDELQQPYMWELADFVARERRGNVPIYPPEKDVFNAFYLTPYDKVKVLIMGQDPYHGPGQAHGLSFSVPLGVSPPPSLKNIFKELVSDLGIEAPKSGCLVPWAKQGVMLLNATLTVRESVPKSHYGKGWERFTDAVVAKLCQREDPVIFLLWGRSAQEKLAHIVDCQRQNSHSVLSAAHPSPFSANRGFFGCSHFSKVNQILHKMKKQLVDWSL